MKFNLPKLPPGWRWEPLSPLIPNDAGDYEVSIRAVSNTPGEQHVWETLAFNVNRDAPEDIIALFEAVCNKIALRIVEVQSRPVQRNIDVLTDIYKKFEEQ